MVVDEAAAKQRTRFHMSSKAAFAGRSSKCVLAKGDLKESRKGTFDLIWEAIRRNMDYAGPPKKTDRLWISNGTIYPRWVQAAETVIIFASDKG